MAKGFENLFEIWNLVFEIFYMLPSINRLAKVRDFNLLIKHGRWINGQFMDLKYFALPKIINHVPKREDPDKFVKQLKVAFSVGLKISKNAVKRNRVKRQMRETTRLLLKADAIGAGYYLLFAPKPASATAVSLVTTP